MANPTIKDLFRVINDMRGDINKRFDKVDAQLKTAADERQAIRDVVDNELASHGQVVALEGQMQEVSRSQRKLGKRLDVLTEEVRGSKQPI